MTDETVYRTMLFDFYGELLTEKQREYFDLHYNEDYSLTEIAQTAGVSRQAVQDIIRRAEDTLRQTEEKLGLVRRFGDTLALTDGIIAAAVRLAEITQGEARTAAQALAANAERLKEQVYGI